MKNGHKYRAIQNCQRTPGDQENPNRSQHSFNIEIDHLKEAFACPWLRKCVKNLHNVEWGRSQEDRNSLLEDGEKVLGYMIKFEIDAFIGKSEDKEHDDRTAIKEILNSIINWKLNLMIHRVE